MMSGKIEIILEKCLARLKAGATVEDCLQDFPEQRTELKPLLLAAVSLYSIPEMSVSDDFRRESRKRLVARIRSESRPVSSRRFRIPALGKLTHPDFRLLVPAALVAMLALIIWLVNPQTVPSSVPVTVNANKFALSVLNGIVEMRSAGTTMWQTADNESDLVTGTGVRTSPDAHAVITFFDGSTAALDPETEVDVVESSLLGQSAHIILNQYSGELWNHVIGSGNEQPYYAVQTPQVTLVAQGTSFSSQVEAAGGTNLAVIEGTVQVIDKQNTEVSVTKDQQINIANNLTAAAPAESIPAVKNELLLSTDSAGISSVCDPNGASTGYLPNGVSFNQIPNSKVTLSGNAQLIQIEEPLSGEYTITVRSISKADVTLAIQLVQNDQPVYQNKVILTAASGDAWTVHFNLATLATTTQNENTVTVAPLTGKSPESVVQMPLAIQRATSLTAATAATTSATTPAAISSTKTTTTITKPPVAVSPTTTPTKPATGNTLPPATSTTTSTTTPVTKPPAVTVPTGVNKTTTTTTPATKPTTTKTTDSLSNSAK